VVPKLIGQVTEVTTQFLEAADIQSRSQSEDTVVSAEELPPGLEKQVDDLMSKIGSWLNKFLPQEVRNLWKDYESLISEQMLNFGKAVSVWLFNIFVSAMRGLGAWTGYLIGFAMVPVFVFFFLLEKWRIVRTWTDYLPVSDPEWKKEVIFVLTSINDSLVVFFRGQVLVAICIGFLLSIGFTLIGLKYAVLLGVAAGALSIIPYLGFVLGIFPAVVIAIVQHGDLLHPILTVLVFLLVQFAEGMFITPKIIGDRVGLHPLTVILAVLIGTTLMGGLLGAVLAIPFTAAGRAILVRYVWKRVPGEDFTSSDEDSNGDQQEPA
jgi:predicted PurR-regulated permease PerM